MPTPIRTITLAIAFFAVGFYWLIFLAQPIVEGKNDLNRAMIVMSWTIYPDFLVKSWIDDYRLPLAFLDRVPILLATCAWLGLATLIGFPLTKLERNNQPPRTAKVLALCFACLIGLALLSTVTLLVGLASGLGQRWPLLVSILALMVFCNLMGTPIALRSWLGGFKLNAHQESTPTISASNDASRDDDSQSTLLQRVVNNAIIAATVWLGVVTMLGAWVPPSEFDVVEYHLQAPKEFYQAGRIQFVAHNIYANMPLGAEMHALAAMTLWDDSDTWMGGLIGKSITASISIVGAIMLGCWVAQRLGRLSGWSAAGLWLGTPGITHVAAYGLIDGVLATYVLATALVTAELLRNAQAPELSLRGIAIAALLAGATAALKYPGLIFATAPCLMSLGWVFLKLPSSQRSRAAIKGCSVILLSMSVTCLPWYAKNWWLAGNPVYPLAANVFGGQTLTPAKIAQWQAAHRVPAAAPADASLPQQLFAQASRFGEDMKRLLVTSSFVQPAMILGLACALIFLWSSRPRIKRSDQSATQLHSSAIWVMLGWSIWILAVWWLATHRIDRFWLPITGLWSALAAWGLWQLRLRSWALAQTILATGLFYGVLVCSSPIVADNRYFVSLAALRDDVGDQEHLPRVPLVQTWINQNLKDPNTRVLLIGEARVFEYRVDVVYSTCFDTNPGEAWLSSEDPAKQRAALAAAGITHVLVNWIEIQRYRGPGNYGFSDWPQVQHLEQLVRDQVLEPIAWGESSDQVRLFRVK